ncbi:hypothetical protein E3P77_02387 [Wallemia ichthyophaga]|uniref:C2H2-type domain-containing protein n=2 Tax=Wallemia ichthyophaga TaxID=245174 RepID=A0A4T0H543_WALIC|nr:hypothetical protein E3P98_02743 [Wallemia ichthyophaga]TIA97405.1 hypothetical protein E3P95_02875 [Wallemia ichthyophaga]TIA99843.1 hypothetical protein E3P94_02392 [Wallemia ichthyophaga]TIB10410.1 hypothetical protein E3P90_02875 [Wallemia ichthyophaga]TIB12233.1 hypothetical protein E3P93_02354 [Wallemia ichthyophaga]
MRLIDRLGKKKEEGEKQRRDKKSDRSSKDEKEKEEDKEQIRKSSIVPEIDPTTKEAQLMSHPTNPNTSNSSQSIPVNPNDLEYLIGFKDFIFWLKLSGKFNPNEDKDELYNKYLEYRKLFHSRQCYTLFLQQKHQPWFVEKYYPSKEDHRNHLKLRGWNSKPRDFIEDLNSGAFDSVSFDKPPKDSNESTQTTPYTIQPPNHPQLFIKSIPPAIGRSKLESYFSQLDGFDYLALSDPQAVKRYHRTGWVSYKQGIDLDYYLKNQLSHPKIDTFTLYINKCDTPITTKAKVAPPISNTPDRLRQDLGNIKKLCTHLESTYNTISNNDLSINISQHISNAITKLNISDHTTRLKKELDLYILYLRNAFNTCYYSASIHDFKEELVRKSCIYYRNTANPPDNHEDAYDSHKSDNWMRHLDEKISSLIEPNFDYLACGGFDYDEQVTAVVSKLIKKEDENKFRCLECTKLFRATEFIEKHILNKHSEMIDVDKLDDIVAFNNYIRDPNRVNPLADLPACVNRRFPGAAIARQREAEKERERTEREKANRREYYEPGAYDRYNNERYDYDRDYERGMGHAVFKHKRPHEYNDEGGVKRFKSVGIPSWARNVPQHTLPPSYREAPSASANPASVNPRRIPPPPGAKVDPRAGGSSNTYEDLDTVAGGDDVELQY